ncbi:MAG: L,D-transpeptidase family protein [Anaerolineae bacterium]
MKEQVTNLLRHGESAAHAGKRGEARRNFRAVLALDPTNVPALLWLSWLNDDPRASLAYVARALDYDPNNPRAHAALQWARRRADAPKPRELSTSTAPTSRFWGMKNQVFSRKPGFFWIISGLLVILIAVTLAWSLLKDTPVSAALAPTSAPTATVTATDTATVTATPTPTSTSTSSPTPTATPPPTTTSTPTLPPTQPPTPTSLPILPTAPPLPPSLTPAPLSISSDDVRWIDVDLTNQLVAAYEGQNLVRITSVSTGLPRTPTPTGQYHIWIKLRYDDMSGPGYYLTDVPYVMYFHGGYGLHGTTWHANFGQPMSHGCVNLPVSEAEWLFNWAQVGTMVNVHY